MSSMNLTAFAIHASISFLLCPGYNFMNDLRPSIDADVHSTYLHFFYEDIKCHKIFCATILFVFDRKQSNFVSY